MIVVCIVLLQVSESALAVTGYFEITFPTGQNIAKSYTGVHSASNEQSQIWQVAAMSSIYEEGDFVDVTEWCSKTRSSPTGPKVPIGCGKSAKDTSLTPSCTYCNDDPDNKSGASVAQGANWTPTITFYETSETTGYRCRVYVPPGGGGY
jgi:hypothetical protein